MDQPDSNSRDDSAGHRPIGRSQAAVERAMATLDRFVRVESIGGIVLLAAVSIALIWANSRFAGSYDSLWRQALSIGLGDFAFSRPLSFLVNDGLMTIFFLVVGMEIRREIHEGALSVPSQAFLPVVAAVGGVVAPALIYLALNGDPARRPGWGIPTATDIAFAVGVLALLGRSIPANVRVFLLTLAVVDDLIAVLIIAFFYSSGLVPTGFLVAGAGVLLVLGLQKLGVGSAYAYIGPGAVVWSGLLTAGVHPSLAGVVLGLMTPVRSLPMREAPLKMLARVLHALQGSEAVTDKDGRKLAEPLRQIAVAGREILPPVVRVQAALHPWVSFAIMPLFALANAGVGLAGVDLSSSGTKHVALGVAVALALGKPTGIVSVTWIMVRLRLSRLPPGVTWIGVCLIGLLGGIGFTMSIFVAMLAFADPVLLSAAKLGVLLGSLTAACLGVAWGVAIVRRGR
jgi:NhaA family Na+:H+ antiporter